MRSRFLLVVVLGVLLACSGCAGSTHRKGYTRVTKSSRVQKKAEIGYTFTGDASYYGKGFDGKKTASGEIFDRNAMTCAHRSLPFGTKLKVVRVKTGASVVVRVNDRGPYAKRRVLDLSEAAGKVLGLDKAGHAQVTATVIE
ncbi:septal ring lytic transglycosylase RlpA family protein [Fibrobacter succinogenes]|uniref:septal ring lytic transglycosylase RlpA family protein n=1 Tax=Fibrobacter succinogenes TaxID=833 RepID=UPI0015670706|nr:septal ring lytic transglycosylase RlpA family protein [Fibrobacter succinogenes]MBO4828467.1 septal ring lytic transglycosylase RlpA family protein [Fibrobacter sp.]MBQ2560152.1 septal ring lytic transglycosylase RlpA family protein [Fibrobacter sp.]